MSTDWPGTFEQRQERREQVIGELFLPMWKSEAEETTHWVHQVRERTPRRDAWIWAKRHRDRSGNIDIARAQIAGRVLLAMMARAERPAEAWFTEAARYDDAAESAQRIVRYLRERLAAADDPRSFGVPLRRTAGTGAAPLWRYRVGGWRIVARIEDDVLRVLVLRIAHRREVYR